MNPMIRLALAVCLTLAARASAAEPAAAKPNPKHAEFMREVEKGKAGDVHKQTVLGFAYLVGQGVAKDEAKAVEILRMASERGYALAQGALGQAFVDGSAGRKDAAEAARWLERAAEQGNTLAQKSLALQSHPVEGARGPDALPEDPEKTYFWSTLATLVETTDDSPKMRASMMKLLPPERIAALDARLLAWEPKKGPAWKGQQGIARFACYPCVRRMAEDGEPDAQWMMGNLYSYGIVLPKDEAKAFAWYRRSAQQGYFEAQRSLAEAYFFGIGTPEDHAEAYFWIGFIADVATDEGWYEKDVKLQMIVQETFGELEKSRREEIEAKWKAWKPVPEKKAAKPKGS